MKHNSHIYVAYKAIEFMYEGLYNLCYPSGDKATGKKGTNLRREGKILERLMQYHKDRVLEASWAPDDIMTNGNTTSSNYLPRANLRMRRLMPPKRTRISAMCTTVPANAADWLSRSITSPRS